MAQIYARLHTERLRIDQPLFTGKCFSWMTNAVVQGRLTTGFDIRWPRQTILLMRYFLLVPIWVMVTRRVISCLQNLPSVRWNRTWTNLCGCERWTGVIFIPLGETHSGPAIRSLGKWKLLLVRKAGEFFFRNPPLPLAPWLIPAFLLQWAQILWNQSRDFSRQEVHLSKRH